ncbi:unnamed protein product [Acanthoscelides obtectus]|nr:unnamed protein product [Acanthoscelides obtectus]CAK1626659.1 Protein peste [Acanthoscelides obtectus]
MHPKKLFTFFVCSCCVSVILIVFGTLLICFTHIIYEAILKGNLVLQPGSSAFQVWVKNPVPLYLKLYLFNWTNPKDINNHTIKPHFQKIGPYTFYETKEKTNITWNNNNTVTYKNMKKWWYVPEKSNGTLADTVISVNPVAFSAAYTVRDFHFIVKKTFSGVLSSMVQTVEAVRPVGDVLFDGYTDALLSIAAKLPFLSKNNIPNMDKFGWFYGRNGSEDFDGEFNIDTGRSDGKIGELERWKFQEHTPYYPGKCGRFDGASAGDFFPGNLKKDSIVKMFSSDLCRYVELEFAEEVMIHGITGYKFIAGQKFLDNGTKVPENKCFCDGDCMPSGALNVSNCRHGSPAFVTLPNYYSADPYYTRHIEGVVPDKERDEFYMIFEPKTGIPLEVAARLQLNLRIQPIPGVALYRDLPTVFFPVLYFEQHVLLPEDMTMSIKLLVHFEIICLAVGVFCISAGLLAQFCLCYKACNTKLIQRKASKRRNELEDRSIKEQVPLKRWD